MTDPLLQSQFGPSRRTLVVTGLIRGLIGGGFVPHCPECDSSELERLGPDLYQCECGYRGDAA